MPDYDDDVQNAYYSQGEWNPERQAALDHIAEGASFLDDPDMFEPDEELEELLKEEDF